MDGRETKQENSESEKEKERTGDTQYKCLWIIIYDKNCYFYEKQWSQSFQSTAYAREYYPYTVKFYE